MLVSEAYEIIKKLHNDRKVRLVRQANYFYRGIRIDAIRKIDDYYHIVTVDKVEHWFISGDEDAIRKG